jgi:hypothetical protein
MAIRFKLGIHNHISSKSQLYCVAWRVVCKVAMIANIVGKKYAQLWIVLVQVFNALNIKCANDVPKIV